MTKKMNLGSYETPADFAGKIDYEGGIAEFFCQYESPATFKGTVIEKEVDTLVKAYRVLEAKLEEIGAVL